MGNSQIKIRRISGQLIQVKNLSNKDEICIKLLGPHDRIFLSEFKKINSLEIKTPKRKTPISLESQPLLASRILFTPTNGAHERRLSGYKQATGTGKKVKEISAKAISPNGHQFEMKGKGGDDVSWYKILAKHPSKIVDVKFKYYEGAN